ncbi:MAG TPA: isoamylase [Candidatus Udaeobacter sp.]|nr:isoamylase [Candidatus Udaeobacter sp.]
MKGSSLNRARPVELWERDEGGIGPPGATWLEAEQAWNFTLFSRHATGVTLLLYGPTDFVKPVLQLQLNRLRNKTARIWHCLVQRRSAPTALYYGYRVQGPWDPSHGHRFDPDKILFDPYAEDVFFPPQFSREAARHPKRNDGRAVLGVLPLYRPEFDWGSTVPPRHTHDAVVYELHVKGFTARANSGVANEKRGTFLGLIEKIPYLQELGVTVVELMPVHQFDPQEGNYWGYMTLSFFAPHHGYAVGDTVAEFREMIRAFHDAGIEVWLDVVYNHTAEGDEMGPTYSYRGIDNSSYYLLGPGGDYQDHSGCGNTSRCAHPSVRALVLRSLQHWGERMGVDGFRFDLASVFTRNEDGSINTDSPAIAAEISAIAMELDLRLVAEAWDIDAYLLGRNFPGLAWRQWNGQFRDDLRSFVKGDAGMVGALMQRLYGSDDLFPDGPGDVCRPYQSVNYVTAHDGFCLYDLVSYNQKHNEANGQQNRDGPAHNRSWNCGCEGDGGAPAEVVALRRRQVKNFFTLLMLANGTPMFCAGDEFLNTQGGNNNPYNQDNETTWLDWSLLEKNQDVFRFFQYMIAFRKARPWIGRSRYWRDDVHWYGASGPVDFASRTLAYCLHGRSDLYVMINAFWEPVRFHIQEAKNWKRVIDTSRQDIIEESFHSLDYEVAPRSVVVLEAKTTESTPP